MLASAYRTCDPLVMVSSASAAPIFAARDGLKVEASEVHAGNAAAGVPLCAFSPRAPFGPSVTWVGVSTLLYELHRRVYLDRRYVQTWNILGLPKVSTC